MYPGRRLWLSLWMSVNDKEILRMMQALGWLDGERIISVAGHALGHASKILLICIDSNSGSPHFHDVLE